MNKFYEAVDGEPEEIQISNDAYYFLRNGEPCLDEDNIEEAIEIQTTYKLGFRFVSTPVSVEDSDLVEVKIVPKVLAEIQESYTHYIPEFNNWQLEYRYIDNGTKIEMRQYNTKTGTSMHKQVCDVRINEFKKPYFVTEHGSIIPLWSNKKGRHIIKLF